MNFGKSVCLRTGWYKSSRFVFFCCFVMFEGKKVMTGVVFYVIIRKKYMPKIKKILVLMAQHRKGMVLVF